jgi:hypothetical protein
MNFRTSCLAAALCSAILPTRVLAQTNYKIRPLAEYEGVGAAAGFYATALLLSLNKQRVFYCDAFIGVAQPLSGSAKCTLVICDSSCSMLAPDMDETGTDPINRGLNPQIEAVQGWNLGGLWLLNKTNGKLIYCYSGRYADPKAVRSICLKAN